MTKISPQTYQKLLSGVKLKAIYLKNFEGKINCDLISKEAVANISSKADFTVGNEGRIDISQKWIVTGSDKKTKSEFLMLSFTYGIILESKSKFSKSFFDIYEETSLTHSMWPFVREFIYNITARMNVPPLTLPLLKFAHKRHGR